tara:strand:- start:609 stop:1010 length:402 start_codon:yes stop_codon:yes gene_type:complete
MSKNKKKFEKIAESRVLAQSELDSLDSVVGNMYEFEYNSKTATDPHPLILSVFRKGGRLFRYGTKTYMAGINLNNLGTATREAVIRTLQNKKRISYGMIKRAEKTLKIQYRVYNYQDVENLSLVDSAKYLETL